MRLIELVGDDLPVRDEYQENMRLTVPLLGNLLGTLDEAVTEGNILGILDVLTGLHQTVGVLVQITHSEIGQAIGNQLPDILAKVIGADMGDDIEQFLKDAAAHANGEIIDNTDSPEGGE